MSRARNFLTGTALALVLVSAPVLAQDTAADPQVTAAYQSYASALEQLKSGINSGGDVNAQYEAADAARAELMAACAAAGTPELAVCVETHVSADMRLEGDVAPLPEPPVVEDVVEEPETAEPAPEEPTEPAEAVEPEQAAPEEPAEDPEADAGPEPAEQTEQPEPAPAADEAADDNEAPMDSEPEADADVQGEDEMAPEADVDAEVDADAEAETESEAPEAEADPVSDGADIQAAYAAYVDARSALATARDNEGDVTSAAQQVNVAFEDVVEACETIGAADLAACLDQYISADARLDNDLSRIEVPEPDATAESEAEAESEAPDPEDVAPVLDSEKEEEPETGVDTDTSADAEADADASAETDAEDDASEASDPAPQSDEEAQANVQTEQVQSSQAEQGEELSAEEGREATRRGRAPEQAEVVEQNNFRIVFRFGDQLVVRNQDNTRLGYDARDTRYERLGNGRFRETIFRENGSQLITIYNRNGDILQRSVIEPDGTEYFLFYTPEDRYDDVLQWRDPAQDLPPLRLTIPANQYVLDARTADEQRIYQFLDQPPVERIDRLYSVDEVKRSARLRDVMRRLEIGDLTFNSGSAALSAEQFGSLNVVAGAINQLLADNPREVFLIEGHTDAVGSDVANLALSDRRAETVAVVLTQTFGIPAENLVTQGYGERYLAVRTDGPERLNRRVTVKRITPLVSPRVAAAG